MRKILSFMLIAALIVTSIAVMPKEKVYAEEKTPTLYYYLDMGVYVVAYTGGKWSKRVSYGSPQPYTATLNLGNNVKVKRIMSLADAEREGLNFWNKDTFTTCIERGVYSNPKLAYQGIYEDWASTNITEHKIISGSGNIKFSVNAVLQSKYTAGYDLVKKYREYYYQPYNEVKKIVVKDNSLAATIKQLEAEKAGLWPVIESISSSGATDKQKAAYKRYRTICNQLVALKNKPGYTTKEEVMQKYKLDAEGFVNEVFKFWGSEAALKKLNYNMYAMLKNMSQMKEIDFNDKYYMVFIPTLLELEELEDVKEKEVPVLHPDSTGTCGDSISWSESKTHSYPKANGLSGTCTHRYYYKAKLTSTATLTADKPNGSATKFKSGYGFKVNANSKITISQYDDNGNCGKHKTKAYSNAPKPPTAAEVRTDWKVINKEKKVTQKTVISMAKGSSTATNSTFTTAANAVSNYNKALIYTDVAMSGTKAKPANHTITVYVSGGGNSSMKYCTSIPLRGGQKRNL